MNGRLVVVAVDIDDGSDMAAVATALLRDHGCELLRVDSKKLSIAGRAAHTICTVDALSVDIDILLVADSEDSHVRAVWDALELSGVTTVNSIAAVRASQDRRRVTARLRNGAVPVPDWVSLGPGDHRRAAAALLALGCPAAVKLPRSQIGEGLHLAWHPDDLYDLLDEHGREHGLILQRYIPSAGRDPRVVVIGGEARSATSRSELTGLELTPRERAVAEAAARALALDVAVVDIGTDGDEAVVFDVDAFPELQLEAGRSGVPLVNIVAGRVLHRALLDAGRRKS